MSKRKKSYDKVEYDNTYGNNFYYSNRIIDQNPMNNNIGFNSYLGNLYPNNNFQDQYNNSNLNNIIKVLNNIDFNNLNNIFSLLSNGFDINNNFNSESVYRNDIFDEVQNKTEIVINFMNSMKPLLGNDFSEIIDKFIDFYMDEVNDEK